MRQILWQRELTRREEEDFYESHIFTQYWYVLWELKLVDTNPDFFPNQTHIAVLSKKYMTQTWMEPPSQDVQVELEVDRNFATVERPKTLLARDLIRVDLDLYRRRFAERDTCGRLDQYHI